MQIINKFERITPAMAGDICNDIFTVLSIIDPVSEERAIE